jgi:ATP-binding cassette, subfamily D (ALD), member 3
VCVPGVRSREAAMVAAIAVLLGARSWLDLWTSSNGGHVVRAIVARNKASFLRYAVRDIAAMMVPCALVNNSLRYSLSRLKVMWRRRLSMYFHDKYLANNTFYKVSNLDSRLAAKNIDQLLTADVDRFCSSLADLYSNISKPAIDIVLTSRKLAATLGPEGPLAMIAYFMVCSAVLRTVQPPFGDLVATEQKLEGEYRLRHSRLIAHSEEIAFYGGGERETLYINQAFDKCRAHAYKVFGARWRIGFMDAILVKYMATIVGYSVVSIPIFFSDAKFLRLVLPRLLGKRAAGAAGADGGGAAGGGGEGASASDIAGQYTRNSRLLLQLASAIGRLVLAGKEVNRLTGFTQRVANLRDVLDDMAQTGAVQRRFESSPDLQRDLELARLMRPGKLVVGSEDDGPAANTVRFVGVNLISPDSVPLATNLTFEIPRGCHVLLTGPNGVRCPPRRLCSAAPARCRPSL